MPSPVLITGYERSGTTLFRRIFSMWPKFDADLIHEGAALMHFTDKESAIAQHRQQVTQEGKTYQAWMSVESGEKMPYGISLDFMRTYLDRWKRWWPDAMLVHVERNPKDVARSCKRTFHGRSETSGMVTAMVDSMRDILKGYDNVLTVSYEDLLENPAQYVEYVYDRLGYNPGAEYIERVVSTKMPWDYNGRLMCGLRYSNKIERIHHE